MGRLPVRRLTEWLFPDPWSKLLAQIILSTLVVLAVTGVFLSFFYDPSVAQVTYNGSYRQLQGVPVSEAFNSILHVSLEVRGGLLIRQVHHWAALILNAAVLGYLVRLFLGGMFRGARRFVWLTAVGMMLMSLAAGFTGYVLPDDLLSGASQRIVQGVLLAIPFIGTPLHDLVMGGAFPGDLITKLYWLHILPIPLAMAALIGLLLHRARKVAPPAVEMTGTSRTPGIGLITAGVLFLMGATMQISPTWLHGPSDTGSAANGSQPDWYLGFLDGALRIFPNWEVDMLGGTLVLAVLVPGLVVPGLLFLALVLPAYLPGWFELRRVQRRALAAGWLAFYGLLWAAAGSDIIAVALHLPVEGLIWFFRIAVLAGPVVAFLVTKWISTGLNDQKAEELAEGMETGVVLRSAEGGLTELVLPRQRPREPELEDAA